MNLRAIRCGHSEVNCAPPFSRYAADNPYRPFCSERCKTQDFGAWASESYRVEAAPTAEDMLLENGSDLVDPTSIPRH